MSFLSSLRSSSHGHVRSDIRMSIIQEDAIYTPGMSYRPTSSQFYLERLPNSSFESSPPAYIFSGAKFSTKPLKPNDDSQKPVISQRRSWTRSALALILILCLVGLVLGLFLGLTQKGQHRDMKNHEPDSFAPAMPIAAPSI